MYYIQLACSIFLTFIGCSLSCVLVLTFSKFLSILSIALAFHGLALALLILITKKVNRLTITYSSLLLVISLILVEYFLSYGGLEKIMPHLIAAKIPLLMLLGPLYFLWSAYKSGMVARPSDTLHAIPFLIVVALLFPFYLLPGTEKVAVAASEDGKWIRSAYLIATFLHLLIYVLFTKKYLVSQLEPKVPDKTLITQMHRGFLILLTGFGVAITYSLIGDAPIAMLRYAFVLALGALLHILAYGLVKTPGSFMVKQSLVDEELQMLASKAQQYLEIEQPYLQKGFSMSDLSQALSSNEKYISKAFNDVLKTSFTSYINGLRIKEAKRLLLENDDKIYAIALDSGFASKNSFTRVFKQFTSYTPAEFRNLHRTQESQFMN